MKLRRGNGKVFCMSSLSFNIFHSDFLTGFFVIGSFRDILFDIMMMDTRH